LQIKLQETEKEINRCKVRNEDIQSNQEVIEATGRDEYYIKRDDEDVYIFVKEDEETGKLVPFEE
jgi:cell division protein FtsB